MKIDMTEKIYIISVLTVEHIWEENDMGVYIPNMEKPKNCRTCKFKSNKEGECWFVHDENDCPPIEIDLVRCGECKWYDNFLGCRRTENFIPTNNFDFCSYGERRNDD